MPAIGFVSSEGGPLLIGSTGVLRAWTGIEGTDYRRACDILDADAGSRIEGALIDIQANRALLWEMEGAGTAYVFQPRKGELLIVRAWVEKGAGSSAIEELACLPGRAICALGVIRVLDRAAAILWATETGGCIQAASVEGVSRPTGEMSMTEAGLIVAMQNGRYAASHDVVESPRGQARRCRLVRA